MSEQDRNPVAGREDAQDAAPVIRDEHGEATPTRIIEQQTARIPSHWFLAAAIGAMAVSLGLEVRGRHHLSRLSACGPGPS